MCGHDLPAEAEPDAAAVPFGGEKRNEYLVHCVIRYSRSIVPDPYQYPPEIQFSAEPELRQFSVFNRVCRVLDEVDQHLIQQLPIGVNLE